VSTPIGGRPTLPVRGGKISPPAEPADHALGRSRGGFSTKIHLVCDSAGLPLAVALSAGQRHESVFLSTALDAVRVPQEVGRPRQRPDTVAGDKGYSYRRVREWLRRKSIRAVIPEREDQKKNRRKKGSAGGRPPKFDRESYRKRNIVERVVGWLKECRRIAMRFEKLAVNYAAMIKLAMIRLIVRHRFSNRA
jgi:transposase